MERCCTEPGPLGAVVGGPSHTRSLDTIAAIRFLPGGHLNHSSGRGLEARRTTELGARTSTDLVVHLVTSIAVADISDALGGTAVAYGKPTTHRIELVASQSTAITFDNVVAEPTHGSRLAAIQFIREIIQEGEAYS